MAYVCAYDVSTTVFQTYVTEMCFVLLVFVTNS